MSYTSELRAALSATKDAKEQSRKAGEGMWANYVRSIFLQNTIRTGDDLERAHTALVEELNAMRELSKDEKNSLRSAKSVVGKAVGKGIDVWQRDESGALVRDDAGNPMPKGKSELQDAKTDYERLIGLLDSFEKTFGKESREMLTAEQLDDLKGKLLLIGAAVGEEWQRAQADDAPF